jgi:serine/threonine protein kinase
VTEVFKVLVGNSAALAVFLSAASLLVLAVLTMYIVAFLQGRSVSFWPPSLGPKPQPSLDSHSASATAKAQITPVASDSRDARTEIFPQSTPAIQVGTKLVTGSGSTVLIESSSYTGVSATLMRARDADGAKVMVKLFWRGLNPSSTAWAEFSREYNAAEGLHHRNIVRTMNRGLWNGYPFIVLEFLPGGTLYDLIKSRDRIPGAEILSVAEQVASGIDYAHTQGRVHRDIAPNNILFESDVLGRVAISDFGIAKILGALETRITAASPGFEGTPAYVAPEVFSSHPITPLVDIYSFGVVLFEMIAGRCPFPEVESVYQLFQIKLHQPVPRLGQFRKVPEDIDRRLFETLSPQPESRPQTARAVLSGIEMSLMNL